MRTIDNSTISLSADELAVRSLPLRALFSLEVLARCKGRMGLAAKVLGISSAALSTQITRLEAALGVGVLTQSRVDGRGFDLSETGEMLVTALRAALPNLAALSLSVNELTAEPGDDKRRRNQVRNIGQTPTRRPIKSGEHRAA